MYEVLNYYKDKIQSSDVLDRESLQKDKYFLISAHREENIDSAENFQILIELLDRLAKLFGLRIIFSTHPRTRKKMESFGYENRNHLVEFMNPYGFFDYISLQKNAFCVISDSGTITEEASLLQFPAITIRQAHERPEGMDEGTVIMTGLNIDNIISSIKITRSQFEDTPIPFNVVPDYIVDNLSKKVVKIIYSYKSYVNRVHWRINDK
jgi:UDP-N-acetylglucosamine 2-epimerase (non-hydrolysing)